MFKNPFFTPAPDPFVIFSEGRYILVCTTGRDIRIRRAKTLDAFQNAEERIVYTPEQGKSNSLDLWAPELHYLEGRWVIYYAATDGPGKNRRTFALQGEGGDPFACRWQSAGQLPLRPDCWAIDATVMRTEDGLYMIWSGWEKNEDVAQNLYICKMESPLKPAGERVLLSEPEYEWERRPIPGKNYPTVNEGPAVLYTERFVSIVYSASHFTSDSYCLGILRMERGNDPLNPANWVKSEKPIFKDDAEKGVYSPGHNSFFSSPDGGERWIAYHAFLSPPPFHGVSRAAFAQRFTLDENEFPAFDRLVAAGEILDSPSGE